MQGNRLPDNLDALLAHPPLYQKLFGGISAFQLEAGLRCRQFRQTKVMEHGSDTKNFAIKVHLTTPTHRVCKDRGPHDMVEEKRLRHIACVVDCRRAKLTIWKC